MIRMISQLLNSKKIIKGHIEDKEITIYEPHYFETVIYPDLVKEYQDEIKKYFLDAKEKNKLSKVKIKTDYKVLFDKSSGFNGQCNQIIEGDLWLEFSIDRNLFNFNESIEFLIDKLYISIRIYNPETNRINTPRMIYYYFKLKD